MMRTKISWPVVASILLLSVSLIIAIIMAASKKPPARQKHVDVDDVVEVSPVKVASVTLTVRSNGRVRPAQESAVPAEVEGRIVEIAPNFEDGKFVHRGDLLVRIDPLKYEVALRQAELDLAHAESIDVVEKGRAEVAHGELVRTDSNKSLPKGRDLYLRRPMLAEAEARIELGRVALRHAKHNLGRTEVRAPFDGLIMKKSIDLGEYVKSSDSIATIAGTDRGEIRLPVSELEYARLVSAHTTGDVIMIKLQGAPKGYEWSARLMRSKPVVNGDSQSIHLVAEVKDPYGLVSTSENKAPLLFGSFVKAEIPLGGVENVVEIPRLLIESGGSLLVVDSQERIGRRNVALLSTEGDFAHVSLRGFEPGDRIITRHSGKLEIGKSIKAILKASNTNSTSNTEIAATP